MLKRNLLAVAIGTLFATSALADAETGLKRNEIQPGLTYAQASEADRTRMDVRQQAKASDSRFRLLHRTQVGVVPKSEQIGARDDGAPKTRAQVRAEVIEAYQDGELRADNAEIGKRWRM